MGAREEYWKLVESERHFNSIQAGIRNRASTWILTAFAAIAVLTQVSEETTWLIPSTILIGLVSLMASVGLLLLWINDQVVYQKLLGAVFIVGLKREYDDPHMPPIRMMMMYSSEGKGMSRWMTLYYTIPMSAFLILSVLVLSLSVHAGETNDVLNRPEIFWVLAGICTLQAVLCIWVIYRKSKLTIEDISKNFGDHEFSSLFSKNDIALRKYKEIIARHVSEVVPDNERQISG